MYSLLSVLILFLSFYSIANARRINLIVKKTNGWHDSATIQSVDYEKLGRKSWDELTDVERYLLETNALRGLNSDSVSDDYDYQEGEYDEITQGSDENDNEEDTDSEENIIEDSDGDDEENSVSDDTFEEGEEIEKDVDDNDNGSNENQSKEENDENYDSDEDSSEDSDEDESSEEDVLQEPSEASPHYNHRGRIGGRAARVWNTRQYQYYHLSVHYLIKIYVKLRSKIDI